MGAFIAYLHLAEGIRHFFVLAPNLTIYNKLHRRLHAEYAEIRLSGHRRVCHRTRRRSSPATTTRAGAVSLFGTTLFGDKIHINIFNISKINSEVRGGKSPRIKRLSEYIGESYFDTWPSSTTSFC